MRVILLWLFCLAVVACHATDYYFSSVTGRDWHKGTIDSPFASLHKLNNIVAKPGDRFLLKSDEVFKGGIVTYGNGSYSKPVIITTYGGSKSAIINGLMSLTHWQDVGNGIYASDPIGSQSDVRNVIIDGKQAEQGRYPNYYTNTGGFLVYSHYVNNADHTTTITSDHLISWRIDSSYEGATIKIKPYLSTLENCKIKKIKGNTLTFDNSIMFYQLATNGCGYFITNSIKTLDLFGEWYYNPKDKRLYVYFGNSGPNLHVIEVSNTDILLNVRNASYALINVVLRGANKYGVYGTIPGIANLTLRKVQINVSGINGVAVANCRKIVIDSCSITDAGTTGINLGYNIDSPYIVNTVVTNVGLLLSNIYCDSLFQRRMGYGIFVGECNKKGLYAYNNDISNIVYTGIAFTGSNNTIYCNYVHNTLLKLDDGGGIYYGGWKSYVGYNNLVRRNIVDNTPGYFLGYPISYPIPNSFFADDYASNITIDSNTFVNSGKANICLHNAYNCKVQYNIFSSGNLMNAMLQDDDLGPRVYGNTITYNYFYSPANHFFNWLACKGDTANNFITQFGVMDKNYYVAPNVYTMLAYHADTFNITGSRDYLLQQEPKYLGYDKTSIGIDVSNIEVKVLYAIHNDSTFSIPGTWINPEGNKTYIDKIILKHHTGIILRKVPVS